ncbi:MAG: MFS transporter [Crocinitomicaceae bacterium]|nr:MFS transporter [Crocinitomicaceae bacterium]
MSKKFIPAYLLTFVNVLGFSILMPVLPFVVESYGAPEWVYGLLLTFYSAFQFIGAPYLGALSDERGRKPILLISQAGTLLSWLIFIIALALPETPFLGLALPLWIIGISRILDGITGGNTSVANAYVSDITTKQEKAYIFGYLGGIAGLGMIIGPGIGGFAASSSLGYTGTLIAATVISIITLIVIFAWLKESLPSEKRNANKHRSMIGNILVWKRIKEVQPAPIVKLIFTMKLLFSIMMAFYIATIALFLIDLFKFNEKELGTFMLVVGIFLSFNQAFVSRRFIRKFGVGKTLIIGLCLALCGLICITLTNNLWFYIAFYYVMNLGLSLCFPTFNSLISTHANPQKQGEIMGISESINSFAMAAFPVIAAALYGLFGFYIYYAVAVLPLAALIIALKYRSTLLVDSPEKS